MNKKNTMKLMKDFPRLYPAYNPLYAKKVKMPFLFDCEDGWFSLIYKLSQDLQRMIDNTPDCSFDDFMVLQVKQKFGGLRYYISSGTKEMHDLIHKAEAKSLNICELCGKRGSLSIRGGFYQTLCPYHRKARGFKKVGT